MKKIVVLTLILGFACANVFAMTPQEEKKARYEEIKKIKDAQRAEHEAEKTAVASGKEVVKKEPGFWEKEGKRSGLTGSESRFSNVFANLNPVPFFKDQQEKYKARKAASQAGHVSEQAKIHASEQSAVAATK